MEHTEHFNLNQPQPSDKVDIEKISENFGTIDQPLYNGQTVHEVVESLMSPEGERPNLYPGDVYAENIEAEQNVTFRSGSSAKFEGASDIDIGTNTAVVDRRVATADAGSIMVRDTNNHVRPSDTDLENVKKTMDGDFKQKTVETTALKVLSAASPAAGDVLVRTSDNYVQASDVTLDELVNVINSSCTFFKTNRASSATIKQGRPCMYNPNSLGYTANTTLSASFVGIALTDAEDGVALIATGGECKALVFKDPSLNYNATFGLTGKAWSSVDSISGFQAATSIADLGGFTTNTRKPRILLADTNDYNNMENNTWALLDVIICMV